MEIRDDQVFTVSSDVLFQEVSGETILLVEDDAELSEMLGVFLESEQATVVAAATARENYSGQAVVIPAEAAAMMAAATITRAYSAVAWPSSAASSPASDGCSSSGGDRPRWPTRPWHHCCRKRSPAGSPPA